jgi:hypothetical protein
VIPAPKKSSSKFPGGGVRSFAGAGALAGGAVALFAAVLYLTTLAPTVLYQQRPAMFDSALLQAQVNVLGIGHPTGYPTYTMLAHLFTYLPVGDPAYRVNLASAVFGVLAVVLVYAAGLKLTGRVLAAAIGALAFAASRVFWSQAVIAEVYTLNALFVALILFVLLLWRERRRDGLLLLAAFLMGLSLTHHITSALLLPVGGAFALLVKGRSLAQGRLLLKGAGAFLAGLAPLLYLPLRAAMDAPLTEADPTTPGRFLLLVTGGSFLLKLFNDEREEGTAAGAEPAFGDHLYARIEPAVEAFSQRLDLYGEYLTAGQFPLPLLAVGALGAFYLAANDRAATALLGLSFCGWTLYGLFYTVPDFYVFLIPAYLVASLWIAAGAGALMRGAENLALRRACPRAPFFRAAAAPVLAALLGGVLLAGVPENHRAEDMSEDYRGREIVETVAREAKPNATVLHHRSSLWYMVLVEERRQDLTLADPFKTSWVRQRDIVWPGDLDAAQSDALYGTGDISGIETARRAAERGPVYLLNQDVEDAGDFRAAGFVQVPVDERGELYELVPRDD